MARSSYIYVVVNVTKTPVAAFTVKHELETWLERHADFREVWNVLRFQDGINQRPYGETRI